MSKHDQMKPVKKHNKDLREALILAGIKLLDEEGLEALTIRRCASMAGVSHAAPAHHFDGLRGLKTAIAARGYILFEKFMREGIEAAGDDEKAKVVGMGQGYVKFSTEHNAMFNLIFDKPEKCTHDPDWVEAATSARNVLNDVSSNFKEDAGGSAANEITIFALTHGYAKLIEIGRITPGSGDKRDVKYEEVVAKLNLEVKPV